MVRIIRELRLISIMDGVRFRWHQVRTAQKRKSFLNRHKDLSLPPAYFMYETFRLDHQLFYEDGLQTAQWLRDRIQPHIGLQGLKILDWGCGPGRVVRHLPDLLGESCRVFGTDYNPSYIDWCSRHIAGVQFSRNSLEPPLQFADQSFDVIYGISIFTHLSAALHASWFNELLRVLRPGGILLLTTQGSAFRAKMTAGERRRFDQGQLIERAKTTIGHRTFSAFQPASYVTQLIGPHALLEHLPGNPHPEHPEQDVWIIRKRDDAFPEARSVR